MTSPANTENTALVLKEINNAIATITMNSPSNRNALSLTMIETLISTFTEVNDDPTIKVVILKGSDPIFCAGHDLREVNKNQQDETFTQHLFARCSTLMQLIVHLRQPVIAQVQGVATAAGIQLVASCDLAVAESGCRFATPGVHIGLFCSTPMVALSRNVAPKHAMQLLLTGELIDADTALRMGVVNKVVAKEQLEEATQAMASTIASKSGRTLNIGKTAFYQQLNMSLDEAYNYASDVMAKNLQIDDAKEGIDAFINKRHPNWKE